MSDINEYATWAKTMWISKTTELDGRTSSSFDERDLTIMSLGLPGETGEVVEILKKRVRDGNLDILNLKKELGDVLYYWVMLCNAFDLSPDEVIQANKDKLNSRQARGTMQGSGDDR